MKHEGEVFFNIDSRLLFQLGEKLVTNRAVALAELVKNSYDADATHVTAHMNNIKKSGGTIIVEDNGSGMTLSTFNKTWMRIATIDKEENPISKRYKRQKAGEKGIARFACRRLSKRLKLKSVAETEEGNKEELNATFNWHTFTPGSDVDKIPVEFYTKPVDDETPTGTTLILEDTNESWDSWGIRRLRNELTELISPITFKPKFELKEIPKEYDPGFRIDFNCPEFPTKYESFDETFFKNAWAKLSGFVDRKGFGTYEIRVINKIINKIEKKHKRAEAFRYLKNTKLEVYIFSYRRDLFSGSEWSVNKAEKIGAERGGIKVYADKFRVFGYGEKGDDWLRVDYDRSRSVSGVDDEVARLKVDRRPGLRLFRNSSLFGHVVFVRNDNPMLEITVNRERLIDNEAFEELRKFARLGIDFATVFYANEVTKEIEEKKKRKEAEEEARRKEEEELRRKAEELARKSEERVRKAEEKRKKAENERRKAEEERRRIEEEARKSAEETMWRKAEEALKKEKDLLRAEEVARKEEENVKKIAEESRKKAEEEQRKAMEDELQRKREMYEIERSQLRVLASTGTLILIFSHELQALIEEMEEMITNFTSIIKKIPERDRKNYSDALQSFSTHTEMVKELANFLGLIIGRESRLEKKEWVLYPIVESVFRPFKWYLEEFGIEYYNSMPDNLRSPKMYRSELVSVLHNLMSNTIKAVKGENKRRIKVTGFEKEDVLHIWFLDSGKGLDKSLKEVVFQPFESYSEPDFTFGVGTGLGLKIVMDLVKSYNGDIQFIDAPNGWKTCVEITFPKR